MPDRAMRRKIRLDMAIAATIVGFCVFVGAVLWGFRERATIANRICAAQVDDRAALRRSFVIGKQLSLSSRPRTEQELARLDRFWDGLIATVPPIHCENGKPTEGRK